MDTPFKVNPAWTIEVSTLHGGVRYGFTFPNGWGASVVRHAFSYGNRPHMGEPGGLWELAVLRGDEINYEHPVAEGDVRGWLSEDDVSRLLAKIAAT